MKTILMILHLDIISYVVVVAVALSLSIKIKMFEIKGSITIAPQKVTIANYVIST